MDVRSLAEGGVLLHEETQVTDKNGTLTFRGVPQGYVRFQVNFATGTHRGWWKEFATEREYAANAKMVNLHLEPKKSTFTVDMEPPYDWMQGIAVYVQNFWVEAQGYQDGNELYPARTGVTDRDGKYTFERVPCLPTRITVRRPGFALKELLITPDESGAFASPVTLDRPSVTAGTGLSLSVQQPVYSYLSGTTAIPIRQRGLPNSNTEGFDDTWSLDQTTSLPFMASTSYGPRSPWGCGTYELSCRALDGQFATGDAYVSSLQVFSFAFRFPPQQVFLKEGAVTAYTIQAEVVPALYHGTLLAAETVSAFGEPLYRPVTNAEARFVVHENVSDLFTSSNLVHSVTTDENGSYAVALPPGVYGIEIPSLTGYWGEKVIRRDASGACAESGWPYASRRMTFSPQYPVRDGISMP